MRTKNFILATLTAGLLAACSNDNEVMNTDKGTVPASFSGSITGQGATTRAADTSWEAGDQIGISGKSGDVTYTNVSYNTTGDGNFAVTNNEQAIYFQDEQTVTFTAYYPWNSATTIAADTRAQESQRDFDFLWAQASGSKASRNVAFGFDHKMAKVEFTIHCGTDVSFDEVKNATLSLGGYVAEGTFDAANGVAAATGEAVAQPQTFAGSGTDVHNAPSEVNGEPNTVAYTLILFPQEFASALTFTANLGTAQTLTASLDFTEGNRNAQDEEPKNAWVAGRQYNMDITLNKTSINVGTCTITAWEDLDAGHVVAQ